LSDTLRSDHPESIRPFAMMLGAHFVWKPSGALQETVRTGVPTPAPGKKGRDLAGRTSAREP
jgi:hypothetical protein